MRKLLIALLILVGLPVVLILLMLASGTITSSSIKMMLNVVAGVGGPDADEGVVQQRYRLPDGFNVSVYARQLDNARFMRFTSTGDLLLSRPHQGDVLLLKADSDGDGKADAVETLLSDLRRPLGLDLHADWLYIAESNRIGRIRFDATSGRTDGAYETVVGGLSDDGNHWSKTIRFGPDGMLYLAQGSTCNVCEEQDARRATMMRFTADGRDGQIIASGLRNSVGFDWAPWDKGLYATDNGRDLLGDDFPPCELNLIEEGEFYGWPYFNGMNVPDPDMGIDPTEAELEARAPVHSFRAHNAPLGMSFINVSGWPEDFERSALVALHGSWNRSEPDGYKVVSLHWTERGIEERDFLSGFNVDGDIIGRPVDVVQGPDGAVYISDDYAGAIYRVSYGETDSSITEPMVVNQTKPGENNLPDWLPASAADLQQMAADGKALYDQNNCASCHEQGENPALLDELKNLKAYADAIKGLVAPQSPMPVYPFSEYQQRALAVYLIDGELSTD